MKNVQTITATESNIIRNVWNNPNEFDLAICSSRRWRKFLGREFINEFVKLKNLGGDPIQTLRDGASRMK